MHAVHEVGLAREDFQLAARATFVSRKEDLPVFDTAFDRYWHAELAPAQRQPQMPSSAQQPQWTDLTPVPRNGASELRLPHMDTTNGGADERFETRESPVDAQATYSTMELLGAKDFGHFSDEEITQA